VDDNTGQNTPETQEIESPAAEQRKPGWLQVIASVLAAGFGVQSKKNRERDFQHGKPIIFIVTGLVFTVLFIVAVTMIVNTVLEKAG
jgi:hypothetical protein